MLFGGEELPVAWWLAMRLGDASAGGGLIYCCALESRRDLSALRELEHPVSCYEV